MTRKQFEAKCRAIDEDVEFYDDDRGAGAFQDDGALHVTRCGVRAAFDVANDNGATQNAETRRILAVLKISVTERVLVKEGADDDADVCSRCGRSW